MHFEMEDLLEQANEIQESLGRSYAVPDELDEADLEAGASLAERYFIIPLDMYFLELDALGLELSKLSDCASSTPRTFEMSFLGLEWV